MSPPGRISRHCVVFHGIYSRCCYTITEEMDPGIKDPNSIYSAKNLYHIIENVFGGKIFKLLMANKGVG